MTAASDTGRRPSGRSGPRRPTAPLDNRLRRLAQEILEEPVPARLLEVLRQADRAAEDGDEHQHERRRHSGRG